MTDYIHISRLVPHPLPQELVQSREKCTTAATIYCHITMGDEASRESLGVSVPLYLNIKEEFNPPRSHKGDECGETDIKHYFHMFYT